MGDVASAQVSGGLGSGGLGGRLGGGAGLRNNSIANPRGSLTPNQVFNPSPSLSSGQIFNPSPSLNRPRSGIAPSGSASAGLTDQAVRVMPWPRLRTTLRETTSAVGTELDGLSMGEGWQNYLRLSQIQSFVSDGTGPPDSDSAEKLNAILAKWTSVAENDEYRSISETAAFRHAKLTLREYLQSPPERTKLALAASSQQLHGAMQPFPSGVKWQNYLAVPIDPTQTAPDEANLKKALGRFRRVAGDPRLRMVAGLPGFSETHSHLADYISQLSANSATAEHPSDAAPQTRAN